jgi:hypothetical protein
VDNANQKRYTGWHMKNKAPQYPTLLDRAIEFAVLQHAGQYRNNGTTPYIMHPMDGLKGLLKKGVSKEVLLAGFACHDVIEDTGCTYEELVAAVGKEVADLVMEVTKMGIDDQGIVEKMAFIKGIVGKSTDALLLKIQDRFCNYTDYLSANRRWYPGYYAMQAYPYYEELRKRRDQIIEEFGHNTYKEFLDCLVSMSQAVRHQYGIGYGDVDKYDELDRLLLARDKGIYGK